MTTIHPERVEIPPEATDEERARAILDTLSSYIEFYHGGSVELVSFDGEILKIKMRGACAGCPLTESTLHGWIEGNMRQVFPNLKLVQAV